MLIFDLHHVLMFNIFANSASYLFDRRYSVQSIYVFGFLGVFISLKEIIDGLLEFRWDAMYSAIFWKHVSDVIGFKRVNDFQYWHFDVEGMTTWRICMLWSTPYSA